MPIVIAYDITDDQRRYRVADRLNDYGRRVPYSVFELVLDSETLPRALAGREEVLNADEDKGFVYPLCETCQSKKVALGKREATETLDDQRFRVV